MRGNHTKAFVIFLIAVIAILQYRLWLQPGGIVDMVRLKKQLALETVENDKLKKRNDLMIQQIQNLQKDPNAIEARARGELGMVKQGETFYQVVK